MNWKLGQNGLCVTVTDVAWERVHLSIFVKITQTGEERLDPLELDFFAVNISGEAHVRFQKQKRSADELVLKVNITNPGNCQCIPAGTYTIYACKGEDVLSDCFATPEVVGKVAEFSRNFLHWGRTKNYSVTFFIADEGETLPFRMHVANWAKIGLNFPVNPKFYNRFTPIKALKDCFFSVRPVIRRMYGFLSWFYRGKREKTILFLTEQSDVIKSNLKAVSDRMVERGLDKDYTLLYSARKPAEFGQSKLSWLSVIKKLSKSGTIFIDDHVPFLDWLKLKDDTRLIQLWHAGAGFKSSGYSRWGNQGCPSPQSCHRQYTYGIAGSKNIAPFFSEVWGINDEQVLPTGMPRMDEFLDEEFRKKKTAELYEQFPICKDKRVILFAPTYRGKNQIAAYYPYELIDFEKLYRLCGQDTVVLFKMHPWVNKDIKIPKKYKDRFLSVLKYPNINDLFYITDLLITDYSSNIFEYSLMRKPMLFFAFDELQYSFARGFHRNYEEAAPGKVCHTFDELITAMENEDYEFQKVEEYIKHHFDYIDSHASDRVIDWILLDKLPEDLRTDIEKKKQEVQAMEAMDFVNPDAPAL